MSGFRYEIEAGPAREALVGGGAQLLVRVALFDEGVEDPQPCAYTDLRADSARHLAFELLAAAEDAEQQSDRAGFWETGQ